MDRPMVVAADDGLEHELSRLAAAAGTPLHVVTDAGEALRRWSAAPLVLVGADRVAAVAGLGPGRRPGVHVVGWSPAPDSVYRGALAVAAESVLEIPGAAAWVVDTLADLGEAGRGDARMIGVVAGSGGAGATTFASALAQVAAGQGPTVLVDLDPWGAGADRALGLERTPGVRWEELSTSTGRLSGRSLREALPHRAGPGVLTWRLRDDRPLDASVAREALSAASRGHDTVVVDLPRSADPIAADAFARCTSVLLVVRTAPASLVAAAGVVARAPDPARMAAVVRGTDVDPARVAERLGLPVAVAMADHRGLAESVELGLGPVRGRRGALARACRGVLAA